MKPYRILLGAVFRGHEQAMECGRGARRRVPRTRRPCRRLMLSEHQCEGFLEGYLLTGRHGLFNSYEAFIRIVDSMFSQHAKWLKVTSELPWRRQIASLNYLLASHVWQQDHNGFTHQDPGFLDHVDQQEGRYRPLLPACRCQLPAVGVRPLPAQPALCECRGRRKARSAAVADDGTGRHSLHRRARHLGVGKQRSGMRSRTW